MRSILASLAVAAALPLQAASPSTKVTFNKEIAPIIYRNCSPCHRPGEAAPFSLLTYKEVAKKGATIGKVTASHLMPPWKPEPGSFAFRDERRLTGDEIALIQAWVKQGMPEGKSSDKTAPPTFGTGWALGEPDMIVEMPAAYHMPAEGPDVYRNLAVPLNLPEDKWIAAIDMRPSSRTVVHHVLYFADPTGRAHNKPPQGTEPGFNGMGAGVGSVALGGWAVGAQPHFFPEGLALKVPKGSDLIVQYHFHPTGRPEAEQSRIGLYFAKKVPERTLARIQMPPDYSLFSGLDIPAGEKDFVLRDSYTLPVAIKAVGVAAHAHYIARTMKMTATLPNGEVKTLISIPDWDFAWQDRYFFQELQPLPAGTRLDAEIHWDNSAGNLRNPSSPPVRVTWGEESRDEMGSVSLIVVAQDEAEAGPLRQAMTQRRNKLAREKMFADPELAKRVMKMLAE